ncbi:MAG: DMT family transporter [Clostridiales bacterium]|nr:DMT family transporter [Clostridiales bacterium]
MISKLKGFFGNVYVYMTVLLLCWGTLASVSKLLMQGIDSYQLQFYLYGLAFLTLLPSFFMKKKHLLLKGLTGKQWLLLAGCAVFSYAYLLCYMLALQESTDETIVPITMLNYLYPVFIVLLAHPVNGEKLTIPKLASTAICFLGAYIVVSGGRAMVFDPKIMGSYALAFAAAVLWGLFSAFGKKNTADIELSNVIYIGLGFAFSTVAMLANSSFTLVSLRDFSLLFWLSAANFTLSYGLWFKALKTASAALAANMSFLTPFVTIFFIAVIFKDTRIELSHMAGLLTILIGMKWQDILKLMKEAKGRAA